MFDWVTGMVEQTGYVGIALLMLAENLFPPIPSEMIMPLAGFAAARASCTSPGAAGRDRGLPRRCRLLVHGRPLGGRGPPEALDGTARKVAYRDAGGCRPGLRLVRAAWRQGGAGRPPGARGADADLRPGRHRRHAACEVPAYSALGTSIWTTFLTAAGYLLEDQHQRVAGWLNPVSNVVIGLLVLWYLYRVATFGRRAKA